MAWLRYALLRYAMLMLCYAMPCDAILGFVIAESADNFGTNIVWLFIYLPALLAGMAVTLVCWFRSPSGWQRALAFMAFAWNLLITGATLIFSFNMLIAR